MRAVLVPAAPGLLPCQGLDDPFAEARSAAVNAIREAGTGAEIVAAGDISASLVTQAGLGCTVVTSYEPWQAQSVLVVAADGSAMRTEKAPGYFDERAEAFDAQVETALLSGDAEGLLALDDRLAKALWCQGMGGFRMMAAAIPNPVKAVVTYAEAPFGVAYWVATWSD